MLLLLACSTPDVALVSEPAFRQDAVLLVWMPYDNDLSAAVGPVLAGLQEGSTGGVEVAVQVDRPDQPGMERVSFVEGVGQTGFVESDDSGSGEALADFLDWAATRYEARRYGLVVLDHGGDLMSVARDDSTGNWLSMQDIATALVDFDEVEAGEVELLFLQVCGKASVEPLQVVAPAANFTLASQLPLLAPNTWYASGLKAIAEHPEWDGADWAKAIASAEGPGMYWAMTCVDNTALQAWEVPELRVQESALLDELASTTWPYAKEVYVDLDAVAGAGTAAPLLCGHHVNPTPPYALEGFPQTDVLSGLSVAAGGALTVEPGPTDP